MDRLEKLKGINASFLTTLIRKGFHIAPNAVCVVTRNTIELGIAATGSYMDKGFTMAFGSQIQLYLLEDDEMFGRRNNQINFGCSGSFDPSVQESYWRTIHAASILKKWDVAFAIVKAHCKMYADLEGEFRKLNNA